jgi:menaquinol-cytochrome c reductase iron-sulfur subunit
MDESNQTKDPQRRDFLKGALAAGVGALAGLVPAGAGLAVLCDPLLRRQGGSSEPVRVAALDTLPADGVPRKFAVLASHSDAWNRFPSSPIGAVYLRRTGDATVQAFNAICPHAGCFVDFMADRGEYLCPCHNSSFAVDGQIKAVSSPSPRGLDTLEVEIRGGGEVWVKFQNYIAGHKEKIPVA